MGAVVWADASDDEQNEPGETEAHGGVDETLAERRLRRWIRAMFGGHQEVPDEQSDRDEP
jgi:hypothetical protein